MTDTTHHHQSSATGFHKLLKEGTQDLHDQAEAADFQTRMVHGDLAKSEFAAFLTQMLHLHHEIDAIYDEAALQDDRFASIYDSTIHKRLPLIQRDLSDLGVEDVSPAFGVTTSFTDAVRRTLATLPVSVLGLLYVKEGATNGNKFVLKKIQATLGLADTCATGYMDPHGMKQRKRWNQFKRDLNELELTIEEQESCLGIARRCFSMFMEISGSVSKQFDLEQTEAGPHLGSRE